MYRRKTGKKWIPFVLATAVALSSTSISLPVYAEESTVGEAVQGESSLTGKGTKAEPYLLETAGQLQTFADLVNSGKYQLSARLTADITVTDWIPIADYEDHASAKYTGVFDGDGYTVTITSVSPENAYSGMFGYNAGTIKNLTVAGEINGRDYAAGVAAINKGKITNCKNKAAVTVSGEVSFAGGITASNYGSVKDVANEGRVQATGFGSCVGGIAGTAPEGTVKGAKNSAEVLVEVAVASEPENTEEYHEACAGGIVGLNYMADIEESTNQGRVSSTDKDSYVGGIAGLNNGGIDNSLNAGSISGVHYTGGIAGYLFRDSGESRPASIENSLNTGTVTATKDQAEEETEPAYTGGIAGNNHNGTISNNYYIETSGNIGVGDGGSQTGGVSVTETQLTDGSVTYKLNGSTAADPVWYQKVGQGTPVLEKSEQTVVYEQEGTYTNNQPQCVVHQYQENGACSICGTKAFELKRYSLTADGSLGLNFYFAIKEPFAEDSTISVEFTKQLKSGSHTQTVALDPSQTVTEGEQTLYGFTASVKSDEMTIPIEIVLKATTGEGEESRTYIVEKEEPVRVMDYLLEVYKQKAGDETLRSLVQSLATYDYYAMKYFQSTQYEEPEMVLADISKVTAESLSNYKQTQEAEEGAVYGMKHYSSSMQLLDMINGVYYVNPQDVDLSGKTLVMGYKYEEEEPWIYVETTPYQKYYYGRTDKIPPDQSGKMLKIAFFLKEGEDYERQTLVKQACPYSYFYSNLNRETTDSIRASQELAQAYCVYSQAFTEYLSAKEQGEQR